MRENPYGEHSGRRKLKNKPLTTMENIPYRIGTGAYKARARMTSGQRLPGDVIVEIAVIHSKYLRLDHAIETASINWSIVRGSIVFVFLDCSQWILTGF